LLAGGAGPGQIDTEDSTTRRRRPIAAIRFQENCGGRTSPTMKRLSRSDDLAAELAVHDHPIHP
jgi:hypothetical protein